MDLFTAYRRWLEADESTLRLRMAMAASAVVIGVLTVGAGIGGYLVYQNIDRYRAYQINLEAVEQRDKALRSQSLFLASLSPSLTSNAS